MCLRLRKRHSPVLRRSRGTASSFRLRHRLAPSSVSMLSLNAVLTQSDVRDRLFAQGVEPRGGTPIEFAAFLKSEIPKWTKVVRDTGAKAE